MKISIIGLGFVGTVTGAGLAEMGHDIVGVDLDARKTESFGMGRAPIAEPDLDRVLMAAHRAGRLSGAANAEASVIESDMSVICVGTTSGADGSQNTGGLDELVREIGRGIARKQRHHYVVLRTTVLPGTTRGKVLPALQDAAGGAIGERFGLAVHPEFMREASALADFRRPPRTVIGELDEHTADTLASLYSPQGSPIFRTSVETAEMAKYADNSWHALKVAFANEIGSLCFASGLDPHAAMDIFHADTVLNLSGAYLRPGFAFGGPCLAADVRTLVRYGVLAGLHLPVLSHVIASNEDAMEQAVVRILRTGHDRIGILGLAHKAGAGDLRGSTAVAMVERLRAAGRSVRAFDPGVFNGRRRVAGPAYIDSRITALDQLLVENLEDLLAWAETVVFTSSAPGYTAALDRLRPDHTVVDLTHIRRGGTNVALQSQPAVRSSESSISER